MTETPISCGGAGGPDAKTLVSCLKTLYDFCFLLYVYVGSNIKFFKFIYCSNDFSPPGKAHYDSALPPPEGSPCTVACF